MACSVNHRETVSLFKFPIKSLMIIFELNLPVSHIYIYIYIYIYGKQVNILYILPLNIGGECGQINLNCEHKPSYLMHVPGHPIAIRLNISHC